MFDFEMFKISYIKIFSMPVPLHLKSFLFEQINRTLPSRKKLAEMKIIDSNLCIKCNIKAMYLNTLLIFCCCSIA